MTRRITMLAGIILVLTQAAPTRATTDNLGNGIFAITQSINGTAGIVVDHTSSLDNAGSGIFVQGAGAVVQIGSSTVAGNAAGLNAASGGQIFSYQNNQASGNVFDGAPTGTLSLK